MSDVDDIIECVTFESWVTTKNPTCHLSQEESHAHKQLVCLHRRESDGVVEALPLLRNDDPRTLRHRCLLRWALCCSVLFFNSLEGTWKLLLFLFAVTFFFFAVSRLLHTGDVSVPCPTFPLCRISIRLDTHVRGWDSSYKFARGTGHAAPTGYCHWHSDSAGIW